MIVVTYTTFVPVFFDFSSSGVELQRVINIPYLGRQFGQLVLRPNQHDMVFADLNPEDSIDLAALSRTIDLRGAVLLPRPC